MKEDDIHGNVIKCHLQTRSTICNSITPRVLLIEENTHFRRGDQCVRRLAVRAALDLMRLDIGLEIGLGALANESRFKSKSRKWID